MPANKTKDETLALFQDNMQGDISASDMREYVENIWEDKERVIKKLAKISSIFSYSNIYTGDLIVVYNETSTVDNGVYMALSNQPINETQILKVASVLTDTLVLSYGEKVIDEGGNTIISPVKDQNDVVTLHVGDTDKTVSIDGLIVEPIKLKDETAISALNSNSTDLKTLIQRYNDSVLIGDAGITTAIRSTAGNEPVIRIGSLGNSTDYQILHTGNISSAANIFMEKTDYDSDNSGIVDNAEKINGVNVPFNTNKAGKVLTSGIDGQSSWEYSKGTEFDLSVQYNVGDIVSYNENIYTCIAQVLGISPDNASFWKSAASVSSSGKGILWNATENYAIGDSATLNGFMYISKTVNTNINPETSSADWQLVYDQSLDGGSANSVYLSSQRNDGGGA